MTDFKKNWTDLAKQAPLNPQSDKPYHPSHLEKVWTGKRRNALLERWLHGMEIQDAKTKERNRNSRRQKTRRKGFQWHQGEVSELSVITKIIRGETHSKATSRNNKDPKA